MAIFSKFNLLVVLKIVVYIFITILVRSQNNTYNFKSKASYTAQRHYTERAYIEIYFLSIDKKINSVNFYLSTFIFTYWVYLYKGTVYKILNLYVKALMRQNSIIRYLRGVELFSWAANEKKIWYEWYDGRTN